MIVLSDVEGTLVDCIPQTLRCWHETLAEFGFDVPMAELQACSGMDQKEMLAKLIPQQARTLAGKLGEAQGERYRKVYLRQIRAFPRVRDLFARLRQAGYRLALATTCQPDELRVYLELTQLGDLVNVFACGEDVEHGKPHPDLIEVALRRLGEVDRRKAWMLGDTPYDAMAARRAGLATIGLLTGGFDEARLREAGCHHVYRTPADLLHHVDDVFPNAGA